MARCFDRTSLLELRRQPAGFEDVDGLVVVIPELRVAGCGEGDDAELVRGHALGHAERRVGRSAHNGRVSFQRRSPARDEGLNEKRGLSGHGTPDCRLASASARAESPYSYRNHRIPKERVPYDFRLLAPFFHSSTRNEKQSVRHYRAAASHPYCGFTLGDL